jgi:hypothetical protein
MYTRLNVALSQKYSIFVILIIGIFGSLLTPVFSLNFSSVTSDEGGGNTGGGNDNVESGDGGDGEDEPEPSSGLYFLLQTRVTIDLRNLELLIEQRLISVTWK